MYTRLHHPTRLRLAKTTGQIQNWEDFFVPGIAEVPTNFCAKMGFEIGARVGGGNWRGRNGRAWHWRPASGPQRQCSSLGQPQLRSSFGATVEFSWMIVSKLALVSLPLAGCQWHPAIHCRQRNVPIALNLLTAIAPRSFRALDPGAVSAAMIASRSAS
jgi:hypothetical protein